MEEEEEEEDEEDEEEEEFNVGRVLFCIDPYPCQGRSLGSVARLGSCTRLRDTFQVSCQAGRALGRAQRLDVVERGGCHALGILWVALWGSFDNTRPGRLPTKHLMGERSLSRGFEMPFKVSCRVARVLLRFTTSSEALRDLSVHAPPPCYWSFCSCHILSQGTKKNRSSLPNRKEQPLTLRYYMI